MNHFIHDLRLAFRALGRARGFAFAAMLALALGIGANTAVYSLMHTVVLTPLPFQDPDRVVALWGTGPKAGWTASLSYPRLQDWRRQNRTFEAIAGVEAVGLNLTGVEQPLGVRAAATVGDFFRVAKVRPLLGRTLLERDAEGAPVVVIGEGLWKRAFGADPGMVGRTIQLNGRGYEVVGVLPGSFAFNRCEAFLPLAPSEERRSARNANFMFTYGRLKPGVSLSQAQADLQAVSAGLAAAHPEQEQGRGAKVVDFRTDRFGKPELLTLVGLASALVLLMACINVANQLLARATGRLRDMAVRSALGGRTLQILAPTLAESLLISLGGAAAGLLVAHLALDLLRPTVPLDLLQMRPLALHPLALGLTLLTALLTALLCGSAPGLLLLRLDLAQTLKEGARGSAGPGRRRFRNALVVAQVALALILGLGFLATFRSIRALSRVPLGFEPKGVSAFQAQVPARRYPTALDQHRAAQAMVEAVRALPGVTAAGFLTQMPTREWGVNATVGFRGQPTREEDVVEVRGLGEGALEALGVPVRRGRPFTARDLRSSGVALISQSLADRYFPGDDPLLQEITLDGEAFRVVGVVGTVRNGGPKFAGSEDTLYLPGPRTFSEGSFWIFLKGPQGGDALLPAVRQAIRSVDPDLPVNEIRTMERQLTAGLERERVQALLLGLFAALAALLALLGIHGAMSYAVAQRTQEIGIRMSLGATPGQVQAQFLREGLQLAGLGLLLGLAGASALASTLRALVRGVSPTDPLPLLVIAGGLLALAAGATLLPARRAAFLDPSSALRDE